MPSLGLGYIAAQAQKRGFTVTILNCLKEKMNYGDFYSYLRENRFDVIGFQMFSYDLYAVKKHIEIIKSENPATIVVAGGPHPSGAPRMTMDYIPQLDYAFRGEAEVGFPELLERLEDNRFKPRDLSEVPGLVYRDGDETRLNDRSFVSTLDDLEFPSWELLEPQNYPEAPHGAFVKNFPSAPIIISRGCPFRCTFCAGQAISGPGVRLRSIDNVIAEMKYLNSDFGIKEFLIEDENLTLHRELTVEFCEKKLNSSLRGTSWSCPSGVRIDTLDRDLLALMEEAGCYSLALGIEFGTQKMLDLTRKQLTLETIEEKIDLLSQTKIKTTGFFMMGVPGENIFDIKQTIKLALRLRIDRGQFNIFMPLPGSKIGDNLRSSNQLEGLDWSKLFVHSVSYTLPGISRKKLKRIQRGAYLRFYYRPGIIIQLLKEISSFKHLKYLLSRFFDALTT
jgi:radical SAM superfamily enzyme YgiQ (UPF0313 family)